MKAIKLLLGMFFIPFSSLIAIACGTVLFMQDNLLWLLSGLGGLVVLIIWIGYHEDLLVWMWWGLSPLNFEPTDDIKFNGKFARRNLEMLIYDFFAVCEAEERQRKINVDMLAQNPIMPIMDEFGQNNPSLGVREVINLQCKKKKLDKTIERRNQLFLERGWIKLKFDIASLKREIKQRIEKGE